MKYLTRNVKQLVLQIRELKACLPDEGEFDDPLIEQILNAAIDIKTDREFHDDNKKPLCAITGIDEDALPEAKQLSGPERRILSLELTDLLQHFRLYPDFPANYPQHLRYGFIKKLWKNKYPLITKGACYIQLCDYDKANCPFKGYCSICDEIDLEKTYLKNVSFRDVAACYKRQKDDYAFLNPAGQDMFLQIHYIRESFLNSENLQRYITQKFRPVAEESANIYKIAVKEQQKDSSYRHKGFLKEGDIVENARMYCLLVMKWINYHDNYFEAKQIDWESRGCLKRCHVTLKKQLNYCIFIYTEILKARFYLNNELNFKENNLNKITVVNDKNFSAKLALIATDMSIFRWERLKNYLPEFIIRIDDFIYLLKNIRRETEETFPDAREFHV